MHAYLVYPAAGPRAKRPKSPRDEDARCCAQCGSKIAGGQFSMSRGQAICSYCVAEAAEPRPRTRVSPPKSRHRVSPPRRRQAPTAANAGAAGAVHAAYSASGKCVVCQAQITAGVRKEGGKQYHANCFRCTRCDTRLGSAFTLQGRSRLCPDCSVTRGLPRPEPTHTAQGGQGSNEAHKKSGACVIL